MNVLILGNGDEELSWARWLLGRPEHRLDAAFPGFADPALAGIPTPDDLDDALARAGIEAVIVGGPIESRGESLRRAAAEGLAIICLHPPGRDSEPYYQVALSREETGASIVPDLPLRLHPGVTALRTGALERRAGPISSTPLRGGDRISGDRSDPYGLSSIRGCHPRPPGRDRGVDGHRRPSGRGSRLRAGWSSFARPNRVAPRCASDPKRPGQPGSPFRRRTDH